MGAVGGLVAFNCVVDFHIFLKWNEKTPRDTIFNKLQCIGAYKHSSLDAKCFWDIKNQNLFHFSLSFTSK